MRRLLIVAAIGSLAAGCTFFTDPAPAKLRLRNVGSTALHAVVVFSPGTQQAFGDIAVGATTDYIDLPAGVYHYSAFRFTNADTLVIQPVTDFVGEEPMKGKAFTYELELSSGPGSHVFLLIQNVVKDR